MDKKRTYAFFKYKNGLINNWTCKNERIKKKRFVKVPVRTAMYKNKTVVNVCTHRTLSHNDFKKNTIRKSTGTDSNV
jgi:hypothetical protein